MRRFYLTVLLLGCLLIVSPAARADGALHVAFSETFDVNGGTGGHDDAFSGSIASSKIGYDIDGWSGTAAVYGACRCLRFGNSGNDGSCTTPAIVLIGSARTATLTFSAAGWASGTNGLTVTANEGVTLTGNTSVTLENGTWKAYSVSITATTTNSIQLTFTGRRGFLDDVRVEETVTAIGAPSLPDDFLFWPNTTETATRPVTLIPPDSTTVYYTTDGSEPSKGNGQAATLTTGVGITGTTTVKAVACYGDVVSDVVSRTYGVGPTVSGIAAFCSLADGTEARLFLSDDANARVLHAVDGEVMFLRDNTGALCIDFNPETHPLPLPRGGVGGGYSHDQHVAGWIIGRKQTTDGLPKLVATANTTTDYLALAAPVTEPATEPTVVAADENGIVDLGDHIADWVTVSGARVGEDVQVDNRFGTENYTDAYDQALIDASAIVTASNTISPVGYNGIRPVVYVIDEDRDFCPPQADIEHATVRLKRTLGKDYWNTFVVPVSLPATALEGQYRQYAEADGNTMIFSEATGIEAGRPYLVKPDADVENPVLSDVTLSAAPAGSIEDGGYAFTAIYSPTLLKTDKTVMFLKTDGRLYYPSANGTRLKGMRAYFQVPKNGDARLLLDGGETMVLTLTNGERRIAGGEVYDLQGRRIHPSPLTSHPSPLTSHLSPLTSQPSTLNSQPSTLKKGLYIVNGKKMVIR